MHGEQVVDAGNDNGNAEIIMHDAMLRALPTYRSLVLKFSIENRCDESFAWFYGSILIWDILYLYVRINKTIMYICMG